MAIEVEKKFLLDESDKNRLIEGAESIGVKTFTDVYYDNPDYKLTTKDIWLRSRDNRWELKLPLNNFREKIVDQYREIENESEIIEYFCFNNDASLSDSLSKNSYTPFASITTTRTKYKKDGFIIDLDSMDFGYEIAEIEKLVEKEDEIDRAKKSIIEFANKHDLKQVRVRGKLLEYIMRNDRKH